MHRNMKDQRQIPNLTKAFFKPHFMKYLILLITTSFTIISCKSDEQKIEDAKQVVETFVKDIELENYNSATELYPSFSKVGKYWILYDFKITESKIENEEVTIYGTYMQYDTHEESIMFVLKPSEENGNYYIERTKGLSAYFGSNSYTFLKNVGCLRGLETDEEIANACREREVVFTSMVTEAAIALQESVILESHSVTHSFGYISGDMTVKNTSGTTIPSFSYDLYVIYLDTYGNEIYREKSTGAFSEIPAQGSITFMVSQRALEGMSKIGIEFKLTETDWLEADVANYPSAEITCEKIDELINVQL